MQYDPVPVPRLRVTLRREIASLRTESRVEPRTESSTLRRSLPGGAMSLVLRDGVALIP